MANQHIEISTGVRLGSVLFSAVSTLRPTADRFANVIGIMDQVASGADWTSVESQFGVPSGQGEAVYNMITAGNTALHVFNLLTIMDRLG